MPQQPATWGGTDAQGNPLRWNQRGLTWNGLIPDNQTTPKRMPQLRVQLGFSNMTDEALEDLAGEVLAGLYGNPVYPDPPVTQAALQTALSDFTNAIIAQAQGGPAATAAKNNKRDILIDLLRLLAAFVQQKHGNDLEKLLSSGFDAVSQNNASVPLPAPAIKDILNGNTGQLILRVTAIRNARAYEVRHALLDGAGTPGPWSASSIFTNSRSMPVNGLTPGAKYTFEVRAIGGSTGHSDWSDSVSHRSL